MLNSKEQASLIDQSKDILKHPLEIDGEEDYLSDILKSEIFSEAEIVDLNNAIKVILSQEDISEVEKKNYIDNMWKINYYNRPPAPKEFLTKVWIGDIADELYPHVKKAFLDFFDPTTIYRNLNCYWAIGGGKSTLTALCAAYEFVLIYFLSYLKCRI
jgi:hypothetical protein